MVGVLLVIVQMLEVLVRVALVLVVLVTGLPCKAGMPIWLIYPAGHGVGYFPTKHRRSKIVFCTSPAVYGLCCAS